MLFYSLKFLFSGLCVCLDAQTVQLYEPSISGMAEYSIRNFISYLDPIRSIKSAVNLFKSYLLNYCPILIILIEYTDHIGLLLSMSSKLELKLVDKSKMMNSKNIIKT